MHNRTVKKKVIIYISVFLFLCISIFCAVQFYDFSVLKTFYSEEVAETNETTWNIDTVNCGNHYVTISGWAFILKEAPARFNCNIVLKNVNDGSYIEIPTTLVARPDLNKAFTDGTDYTQSGFLSRVSKNQIRLSDNSYNIYIKYFNNHHHILINTNRILTGRLGEQ